MRWSLRVCSASTRTNAEVERTLVALAELVTGQVGAPA
jgi:hypothetical protein